MILVFLVLIYFRVFRNYFSEFNLEIFIPEIPSCEKNTKIIDLFVKDFLTVLLVNIHLFQRNSSHDKIFLKFGRNKEVLILILSQL